MRSPASLMAPPDTVTTADALRTVAARLLCFGALALLLILSAPLRHAQAQTAPPTGPASVAAPAPATPVVPLAKPVAPLAKAGVPLAKPVVPLAKPAPQSKPSWKELNPAQQQALAPLMSEWDKLDRSRKLKWIEMAALFPRMKPEEQQRTQERMREWTRLSPEARRVARDSYMRVQTLPPEKRAELLQQYQQLPDDKKQQLAAESRAHKMLIPPKPASKLVPAQPTPSKAQIRQGAKESNPASVRPPPAKPGTAPAASAAATPAGAAAGAPRAALPAATIPAATPPAASPAAAPAAIAPSPAGTAGKL